MMLKRLFPILALFLASGIHADNCLAEEGRVIVKYRQTPDTLKQALAFDHTSGLSARLGLALRSGLHINAQTQVIRSTGISSEALAARLSQEADVEYAIPDRLRTIRALPNDPLFSGQWYLQATEAASIHATDAWSQTTGSSNVVVAVIDTGVRFNHPDLFTKLLPGYDFISDVAIAGDGNGRDADASDPGDFISASDASNPILQNLCGSGLVPNDSSWHGTRVAGIVGAAGNNLVGIAGTSWGAKILPVRALGKCGGFDSDILAGMRWAAGLSVPGVPSNPNPAKIINLSLGGGSSCTSAYADVIAELAGQGALVVAAAGNETGPVGEPGSCAGVLAVAGVRHVGTKVGYSSFGPEVSVSAPAGNCVNASGPCLFSIETTTNLGTTNPGANGYTDGNNFNVGTSFSAPQAAGVAALMLSLNPALTPADIISRIKLSARAFPTDNALLACPNVAASGDTAGQCNCTTATCGAGILDAAAAVAAAALSLTVGVLGTPPNGSTISGISAISGYHCMSKDIKVFIDGVSFGKAGAGTQVLGTQGVCGRSDTGYSFLYNFSNLANGQHTVSVTADGVPFATNTVTTVKSGGEQFLTGTSKQTKILDFPHAGQAATLEWVQSYQNFLITGIGDTANDLSTLNGSYGQNVSVSVSGSSCYLYDFPTGNQTIVITTGASVANPNLAVIYVVPATGTDQCAYTLTSHSGNSATGYDLNGTVVCASSTKTATGTVVATGLKKAADGLRLLGTATSNYPGCTHTAVLF